MTKFRRSLIGVATLLATAGMSLVPAEAAHARPIDDCAMELAPRYDSGTIAAAGNDFTRLDPPLKMYNNDAFRIRATGTITIDYWGTRKSVGGDEQTADGTQWLLPGARRYMLLAKVSRGWISVIAGGPSYDAGEWFPVGFDSGCMRYHRAEPITDADPSAFLTFAYNDNNVGDNGGAGSVTVRQWR